ncbi:hypothetical protein Dsin_006797 [Dipteronia sinensis]|uniref:TF-B3 domain-containing protein n=1 Tax=Dipteronia sinensis TaxID=43782 RepID=A0AAE0B086_9ROSI|nr:hypothetical protein Dsin_006797 [Dipteronia sinensis]
MSINHISTDLKETLWWQQQQPMNMDPTQQDIPSSKQPPPPPQQQYSSWPSHLYHYHQQQQQQQQLWVNPSTQNHPITHNFNLNQEDEQLDLLIDDHHSTTNITNHESQQLDKDPMFEKPLTPSDVGKLNRLVIPKQHAEKYFPLGGESSDKGLLLSFEDESGKCWRFRYSYWNSSQSYVLTKGWSRYVKEKRLDAGDVIQFERHRRDSERLFIGWRRRGSAGGSGCGGGWNRGGLYSSTSSGHPYPVEVVQNHGVVTVPYQPAVDDCLHAGSSSVVVQNQASTTPPPVVGNSKRLRLFGVNLECQMDESEPSTPDGSSSLSVSPSHLQPHHHHHNHFYSQHHPSYSSNRHTHMEDITFSEDVNQMMRNRQG